MGFYIIKTFLNPSVLKFSRYRKLEWNTLAIKSTFTTMTHSHENLFYFHFSKTVFFRWFKEIVCRTMSLFFLVIQFLFWKQILKNSEAPGTVWVISDLQTISWYLLPRLNFQTEKNRMTNCFHVFGV